MGVQNLLNFTSFVKFQLFKFYLFYKMSFQLIGVTLILFGFLNNDLFKNFSTASFMVIDPILSYFGIDPKQYDGEHKIQKITKSVMFYLGVTCFLLEVLGFLLVFFMEGVTNTFNNLHKLPKTFRKNLMSKKKIYYYDRKKSIALPAGMDVVYESEESETEMDLEQMKENNPKYNIPRVSLKSIKVIGEDVIGEDCPIENVD